MQIHKHIHSRNWSSLIFDCALRWPSVCSRKHLRVPFTNAHLSKPPRAYSQVISEKDLIDAVNKVVKGYKKFSATPKYMVYN